MGPQDPPRRLGRGLDALLARREPARPAATTTGNSTAESANSATASAGTDAAAAEPATAPASPMRAIPLTQIRPNPYQPRKEFRPEELADLQASLKASGLLQPVTVRPSPDGPGYELIAGERRFRAATNLGWTDIPAIVREVDDKTLLTLAMIENLQRADLDPIEEGDGYQRLVDEFALSHQEVADVVGKDRSTVANAIRLLQLPPSVRRLLQERQLTAGHGRALLALPTERAIADLARDIVTDGLSVRETERRVKAARPEPSTGTKPAKPAPPAPTIPRGNAAELRRIEELLKRKLQTAVTIHMEGKDRGELRLAFFSPDDLERLVQALGVNLDE